MPIYGINGKAAFQLVVLLIAIMLTNMAQLVVISGPEPHRTVQIILYAIFFLIELPLFIGFSQYIKKNCVQRGTLRRSCNMNLKIIISPQGTLAIYEQIVSQLKMP